MKQKQQTDGISIDSLWDGRQGAEDVSDFEQYIAAPIEQADISSEQYVVVNSIPKSGTVWVMSLLAELLRIDSGSQVVLSHVNDINEIDVNRPNCLGTVVIVRDLRDVVVSLFHEVGRLDIKAGFESARYPTAEEFYFEFLIGFLNTSPRYNYGDVMPWLDLVTARGYPLVRYEDLIADPGRALRKILRFWKVRVPESAIGCAIQRCRFASLARNQIVPAGRLNELVSAGHLRAGRVGGWTRELPVSVVDDIEQRFSEYQSRLAYACQSVTRDKSASTEHPVSSEVFTDV